MEIGTTISNLIRDQFPEHNRENGPLFVTMVQKYFEWLEDQSASRDDWFVEKTYLASVQNKSANVVGIGSIFTTQFESGDQIAISKGENTNDYEMFTVKAVVNDTLLTLTSDKLPNFSHANTKYATVSDKLNAFRGHLMTEDLVIKNGLVVTRQGMINGGVAVRNEKILQIVADGLLPKAKLEIDAEGAYVLPGIIDPHVHIGQTKEEGAISAFRSESLSAVISGVTTFMIYARFGNALESRLPIYQKCKVMGREQSFVDFKIHAYLVSETHLDEINDLPAHDGVSSDQIDDVFMMFDEMDIDVADDLQGLKVEEEKAVEKEEEESDELEMETFGRATDPVRMYLREMGSVSLLTREGEVEIAKRIESGKREVLRVV